MQASPDETELDGARRAAPHEVTDHRHRHAASMRPHGNRGAAVALQGPCGTPGAHTPGGQPTPGAPHPIGPSSSPIRPFGLVWGCSLALALPGGHRLVQHAAGSERTGRTHDCCCGTPTRPSVPSAFLCRGCPPMHCVKARPIQGRVIACAALACRCPSRAKVSSMNLRPAQRRSTPPRSRRNVPSFHPQTSQLPWERVVFIVLG